MAKQTTKIAIPIIFVGIFAIIAFVAVKPEKMEPDFYVIMGLLFIFIFFFGIAAGQRFSSPVKKLLKQADELSKGNLASRTYLETKDELADLANAFNKIAEELQESREQAQNAEKSVGIKVKAKTQEMEETINALEQKVKNRTIELERLLKEANKSDEALKEK
jgi:nitrogen fixation/metabolism regulation signal transduction histidine kinase